MFSKFILPIWVFIFIRLWTGQSRVRFTLLIVRDLFLPQNLQTGSGAQKAFYSNGYKDFFPQGNAVSGWWWLLTTI